MKVEICDTYAHAKKLLLSKEAETAIVENHAAGMCTVYFLAHNSLPDALLTLPGFRLDRADQQAEVAICSCSVARTAQEVVGALTRIHFATMDQVLVVYLWERRKYYLEYSDHQRKTDPEARRLNEGFRAMRIVMGVGCDDACLLDSRAQQEAEKELHRRMEETERHARPSKE